MEEQEFKERFALAQERLTQIREERIGNPALEKYFAFVAGFLLKMGETWRKVADGWLDSASLEELKAFNHALYEDILPGRYETSYANSAYAVRELGEETGGLLAFLYFEMRSLIVFAHEQRLQDMVIRMELFLEIYGAFAVEMQESGRCPSRETLSQIIYWYVFDYSEIAADQRIREMVVTRSEEHSSSEEHCPGENNSSSEEHSVDNFAVRILQTADFNDVRYLFRYGEYVTDNEIETARYLGALPGETIKVMADTYTEGYRMGFVLGKKDLSRKKTVDVRYALGFERMIAKAVENFKDMGLKPAVYRSPVSILHNPSLFKTGYYGANPNKQYDFDHKDDRSLFLNKTMVSRRLEVMRTAFERYKKEARLYAGPAVVETFGEPDFEPVIKPESLQMTEEQRSLWVEYRSGAGQLQREYILEEERSFTIIAFPVPAIGERFPEIFEEIIRINTLDYEKYQRIQQTIIDTLDRAVYCELKGMGDNRTDLRVSLHKLKNPDKETAFENCVADVNIPVGEVFTSPVLKGTDGILHVSRVFLNGLEYHDLSITFADGMITDYSCGNFASEEENKGFIKENILFHHSTLPLGEFAIGTNTTAYVAAKKYGIENKLPILIAEKMGPHFAVGDTCYSHREELAVFNPDGKEIVARDNEISLLRDSNPDKAYFNCHTDITIPYDELGELAAVTADGNRLVIIEKGRFVLPGCEALNEPFEERDA